MTERKEVTIAVIDMNKGRENQGLRGILEILQRYREEKNINLSFDVFDLRLKGEIPNASYDIYISSGGPGDPFDGMGQPWENDFFNLLDNLEAFNVQSLQQKKHVFFICHSFQLACRKYNLGKVTRRKSTAFGIFPVHLTDAGACDPVFKGLPDSLYAVDSRDWQVVQGAEKVFNPKEPTVLALEKERPHIELERCMMAARFSEEFVGTQFHPEADPRGMKMYLLQEDKKTAIMESHGEEKYYDMLHSLEDPNKIRLTQSTILPNFLTHAIQSLQDA